VPLGSWFGTPVGLTRQGLTAAVLIVMRVATSSSFVVLLTITTPWPRLVAALRSLLVPRTFVVVLGMSYRYVFHLVDCVTDMFTARKARTVARDSDTARGRAFVAASAGALFGKAHALSDEVYTAMVARGYRGESVSLSAARLTPSDVAFGAVSLVMVLVTIGADRVLGR
jgi:cobalt/nickel transport system permease protein